MPRLELRAFADEHLDDAGELLARRHRRHRTAEPLLAQRYEDAAAARNEVEALWRSDDASGAVALRGGRLVGFVVGVRKADDLWGANVWVESAGHAVEEAEDVRDVYATAATRWLEEGRSRHYALVPAADAEVVDAWFRLSFGCQHAHGIREVPDVSWPDGARRAEPHDVHALVELTPLLQEHQDRSPVFAAGVNRTGDVQALRREILEDVEREDFGQLVAERDGEIVGAYECVPIELSSAHTALARPDGAAFLNWAATRPDVRGSGAGLALAQATFAWARERRYEVIVTDWRVTNLLASRFWPARGFRPSFLRLYRSIP